MGIVNPSRAARMLNRIVFDVTYNCTLDCPNCNRLCGVFPRKNDISLSKIKGFVDSSIEMKKYWVHIFIAGGEPSLHPEIDSIFKELKRYVLFFKKEFKANSIVKYFTNNHSKKAQDRLKNLPDFINMVSNSDKKNAGTRFKPMLVAPIDLNFYDDNHLMPCQELYNCGMTLNYKGYYPCAEAAAIDDTFLKKDMAIEKLADVNFNNMVEILHHTCRYCGHYFEPLGFKRSEKLMISQTWKQHLKNMQIRI